MDRRETLELLRYLLTDAMITETDPDDLSGVTTRYYVDQEKFLANIENELEKCRENSCKYPHPCDCNVCGDRPDA